MEIKRSFSPNEHQYWRTKVSKLIARYKNQDNNYILLIEDLIEGALVEAFKLGVSLTEDGIEMNKANAKEELERLSNQNPIGEGTSPPQTEEER